MERGFCSLKVSRDLDKDQLVCPEEDVNYRQQENPRPSTGSTVKKSQEAARRKDMEGTERSWVCRGLGL